MKFLAVWILISLCVAQMVYAAEIEPVVKKNVPILQNATPAQCAAAKNSSAGAQDVVNDSRFGQANGFEATGVRSCTGCAVDSASHQCICATCYYYYN